MASDTLGRYYRYIKSLPCTACGQPSTTLEQSEADHLKPPSDKLPAQFAPRSHHGTGAWYCLPLCKRCHDARHKASELEWYSANVGPPHYVYSLMVRHLVGFYDAE